MTFFLLFILIELAAGISLVKLSLRRSRSAQRQLWLLAGCIIYGTFPLLLAWIGLNLAQQFNCVASAITFQCSTAPWLGSVVTNMVFAHWLMIFTMPFALLNVAIVIFSFVARYRQ